MLRAWDRLRRVGALKDWLGAEPSWIPVGPRTGETIRNAAAMGQSGGVAATVDVPVVVATRIASSIVTHVPSAS